MADITTIQVTRETRQVLHDLKYEYKVDTPDQVIRALVEDLARSRAVIQDVTTRAQVNAEERDQALELLHMTVPELHQAQADKIMTKDKKRISKKK